MCCYYGNILKNSCITHTKVIDVAALGNVHTLNLSGTEVIDVSTLGNVHTLDLSYTRVTDVSALGNVHTLNLLHTPIKGINLLTLVDSHIHTLIVSRGIKIPAKLRETIPDIQLK